MPMSKERGVEYGFDESSLVAKVKSKSNYNNRDGINGQRT